MRLTVVGCSGSFPGPGSAASCYLLRAQQEGRTWSVLLDLGSGALGPLQRHLDLHDIDAVVLSHLHADHCLDLCSLYVTQRYCPRDHDGATGHRPIPVHGPASTAERMARAYDVGGDAGGMADGFDFHPIAARVPIQIGPFTITPHRVRHPVEAFGLRVEADGAVLAYTGDTDTCDALTPLCQGASLMLSDSAFVDGRDTDQGIHLSGSRAARAAIAAGGVARLMLTHLAPWNDPAVCREQAAALWPGDVELAVAGETYEL